MPTLPPIKATTGLYTSSGIINAIIQRDNTGDLSDIKYVEDTTEAIKMVGQEITAYAPKRNSFCNGLVNLIGMMRLYYMMFKNPWGDLKQGKLEMGETIEEIFIGLAEAFPFNPLKSETRVLKRAKCDVSTAFHSINYATVYKVTISGKELKKAFLSRQGLVNLIEAKMSSLARSASYDEFMLMKYLFAVLLLSGKIKTITIPDINKDNANDVVTEVAEITNLFQFPSADYNIAGVENTTSIDDLIIFESAKANAQIKVNALAAAFNVDYVKFLGKIKMFDSLATYNYGRLKEILSEDDSFVEFSSEEIALLKTVELIACDRRFMQIYDSEYDMGEPFRNGEGSFTNYFLHVEGVFSASPFHNVVAYTTATPTITSVTVSPGTATVAKGSNVALQATVTATGFGSSNIIWEIQTQGVAENTYINQDGILHIANNETKASVVVTATSVVDNSKKGSATITVANA